MAPQDRNTAGDTEGGSSQLDPTCCSNHTMTCTHVQALVSAPVGLGIHFEH